MQLCGLSFFLLFVRLFSVSVLAWVYYLTCTLRQKIDETTNDKICRTKGFFDKVERTKDRRNKMNAAFLFPPKIWSNKDSIE